jgi:hypothetical protein
LIASEKIEDINIAHFHLLDVAMWYLAIVSGVRFFTIFFFLKQYDDYYRCYQDSLSRSYERYGWRTYIGGLALLMLTPIAVSNMQFVMRDRELFLFVRYFPRLYFFMILFVYYYAWLICIEIGLLLVWKVFREKWPGAVLWRAESQREDSGYG